MKITYHGHSCIQIHTGDRSLVIDPFLSGNGLAVAKPQDIHTNAVLLTHAHNDHIADAEPIAKNNSAPVVATYELAQYMSWKGVGTIWLNPGGNLDLQFVKVKMIPAIHSSGIVDEERQQIMYGGIAGGFIVQAEGLTILHAGDTALFDDMRSIGEQFHIDVAFLPIGDQLTMGPRDAAVAAERFGAKLVVPIHYNTFPAITQDPDAFVQLLAEKGIAGKVMSPGEELTLS